MWSSIRSLYSFSWLALVLSGFCSGSAFADYWSWCSLGGGCAHLSPAAACEATREYGGWVSVGGVTVYVPPAASVCSIERTVAAGGGFFNYSVSTQNNTGACPVGSSADTSGGFTTCVPLSPCPVAGSSAIPSGQIGYGESALGSNPLYGVLCDSNQCQIKIGAATTIPIGGGAQANYISQATYTGDRATGVCPLIVTAPTPKDPTLPKPIDTVTPGASTPDGVPGSQVDCPSGSAFGQVNGVNVCSPPGSQQGYAPDTTTTTNNGIEGSSTKDVVKTVGEDGSVTTTTTTHSTFGGNSSTTTTTSNNGGLNGLNGADGKGAEPLDFGPAPSAESGDAPTLPGLGPGAGADGAGGAAKTLTIGSHFTGSGACIADRSVTVLGVTVTVPLSQLCPWFDVMYKVVSLMAVFAAMRILVMS